MIYQRLPLLVDLQLLIPVFILLTISLVTLFSIDVSFFRNQLFFTFVACGIFFIFAQIDYKALQNFAVPLYIGSLIILVFVLILGFQSRGAVRWFDLFGFSIQFSEILKPILAIAFASFLSIKNSTSKKVLCQVFLFLLPVVFLIYRQPDLGDALIYLGTVLCTLLFFGFPLRWFVLGIGAVAGSIPVLWKVLHEYQRQRIMTFLHFTNDPLGISYNAIQSVIAVGSGGILGKGLGQGTQSGLRFLPERHTDFIFATLSEELGFIGSIIVLLAFGFLFYRLYVLFRENDDLFSQVFIAACFSLILIQCMVNIGMNIGILPIVGVTLPFVSYGGSSLISNAIFLGFVSAMSRYNTKRNVLEIA